MILDVIGRVKAAEIAANSPSEKDVQAAVNQTHDGDTVTVPAGTGIWTTNLVINDSISLIGAGSNRTFIVDNNPNRNGPAALISASPDNNAEFRISEFCFEGSNNGESEDWNGEIGINGTCFKVRVDHCYCTNYNAPMLIIWGWIYGVCDHCDFIANFREGAQVYNCYTMSNSLYGDGSWAAPATLGSGNAFFFEDDYFRDLALNVAANAIDCYAGSRVVCRHSVFQDTAPDTHGTDTSGRMRGFRTIEVYNNWLTNTPGNSASPGIFRGGDGLCFSNAYSSGFGGIMGMETYRAFFSAPYWGGGTGANPWDSNSSTIFAQGVCAGVGSVTITDTSKNWTPNQWVGYTLYDTNTQCGSIITANTSTTITFTGLGESVLGTAGSYLQFSVGNHYQVLQPVALIDQDGRGQGDLLAGVPPYDTVTGKASWPNEKLEPIYYWSNTVAGQLTEPGVNTSPTVKLNRDYYEDTIPAGYTPYVYPHPLDTTNTGSSSFNLTVVNGGGSGDYTSNAVVSISANQASNQTFDYWSGAHISNTNQANTTVTMPGSNLTVTAFYTPYPPSNLKPAPAP